MFKYVIIGLGLFFGVMGCWVNDLNIKIKFDHVDGLKKHDRVIFEKIQIGQVNDVQYMENGFFNVRVRVKKAFEKAVTEHSRFYIVTDPQDETRKAVEMDLIAKGGKPLEEGITVVGSDRPSVLLDKLRKTLDEGLDNFDSFFKDFSEQLKGIPDSDAYKELKDELERLSEGMKNTGEDTFKKWKNEILPRLKNDLEEFRKRFLEPQRKEDLEKPLEV